MDKTFKDISVTTQGYVASVEIHRPPHNFFDVSLIRQLADAFNTLDKDPNCRSIVLVSEGKSFCAGANFNASDDEDVSDSTEFTESGFQNRTGSLYEEGVRLFSTRKPIIAGIQGAAIGGGLGLSLVADFRVACPEARFAANFVKLGIHPGFGLTVTLPRLIGQQKANEMFLTGRRIKGEEALEIGLVDYLVSMDSLRQRATDLATEIAENAPLAILSTRATTRKGLPDAVERATAHELKEQQWLRTTRDAEEGIRAVAERRVGHFVGE
ncbi:MAG: enoyl-CoA hydratase/isomerase family protein [Gammaproteobacteria bacterium]|nr:enoyl-CoA hydratase/isomerase family protein [Gammaproteobacteria bacterium]MYD80520.1 enoyl-CoA hydratase/isomerase family protein [Gammaproteobacteria bacterium]